MTFAVGCAIMIAQKESGWLMKSSVSPYRYRDGLRDGMPIGLGYFSVSFGFGISAVGQGLRALEAVLISMTNLTSAGQVAGVAVIAAGGTVIEMILTQLVINLRYALMGISITQRLDDRAKPIWKRLLLCNALTDEIYAVVMTKPDSVGSSYIRGVLTVPYLGWVCGTLLGAVLGAILPDDLSSAPVPHFGRLCHHSLRCACGADRLGILPDSGGESP